MMNFTMLTLAPLFYVIFEIDVSIRKYGYSLEAEEKLPFKMSQIYRSSFKIAKTFLWTFVL